GGPTGRGPLPVGSRQELRPEPAGRPHPALGRPRRPAVAPKVDPPACESYALALQQQALAQRPPAVAPPADRPAPIHDPVPRPAGRAPPHRLTDGAGGARRPDERRDLPIGHDAARWDAPHQRVDPLLEVTRHACSTAPPALPLPTESGPNWSSQRVRYRPSRRSNSACGPASTSCPCWRTTTRSARWMVEKRCAITMLVRPASS